MWESLLVTTWSEFMTRVEILTFWDMLFVIQNLTKFKSYYILSESRKRKEERTIVDQLGTCSWHWQVVSRLCFHVLNQLLICPKLIILYRNVLYIARCRSKTQSQRVDALLHHMLSADLDKAESNNNHKPESSNNH